MSTRLGDPLIITRINIKRLINPANKFRGTIREKFLIL